MLPTASRPRLLTLSLLTLSLLSFSLLSFSLLSFALLSFALLTFALLTFALLSFALLSFALLTFALLTFALLTFALLTFALLTFAPLTFALLTFAPLFRLTAVLEDPLHRFAVFGAITGDRLAAFTVARALSLASLSSLTAPRGSRLFPCRVALSLAFTWPLLAGFTRGTVLSARLLPLASPSR